MLWAVHLNLIVTINQFIKKSRKKDIWRKEKVKVAIFRPVWFPVFVKHQPVVNWQSTSHQTLMQYFTSQLKAVLSQCCIGGKKPQAPSYISHNQTACFCRDRVLWKALHWRLKHTQAPSYISHIHIHIVHIFHRTQSTENWLKFWTFMKSYEEWYFAFTQFSYLFLVVILLTNFRICFFVCVNLPYCWCFRLGTYWIRSSKGGLYEQTFNQG